MQWFKITRQNTPWIVHHSRANVSTSLSHTKKAEQIIVVMKSYVDNRFKLRMFICLRKKRYKQFQYT